MGCCCCRAADEFDGTADERTRLLSDSNRVESPARSGHNSGSFVYTEEPSNESRVKLEAAPPAYEDVAGRSNASKDRRHLSDSDLLADSVDYGSPAVLVPELVHETGVAKLIPAEAGEPEARSEGRGRGAGDAATHGADRDGAGVDDDVSRLVDRPADAKDVRRDTADRTEHFLTESAKMRLTVDESELQEQSRTAICESTGNGCTAESDSVDIILEDDGRRTRDVGAVAYTADRSAAAVRQEAEETVKSEHVPVASSQSDTPVRCADEADDDPHVNAAIERPEQTERPLDPPGAVEDTVTSDSEQPSDQLQVGVAECPPAGVGEQMQTQADDSRAEDTDVEVLEVDDEETAAEESPADATAAAAAAEEITAGEQTDQDAGRPEERIPAVVSEELQQSGGAFEPEEVEDREVESAAETSATAEFIETEGQQPDASAEESIEDSSLVEDSESRNDAEEAGDNQRAEDAAEDRVPSQPLELPDPGVILGLTVLDDLLYLLLRATAYCAIDVYSTTGTSFTRQRRLRDDLVACTDMTSCSLYKRLYVAANTDNLVHVLTPDGDATDDWVVDDGPVGLSVTTVARNVLITCFRSDSLKAKLVELAADDGRKLREVQLHVGIMNPWHAVELTGGRFAICHGTLADRVNRVCVVDEEGYIRAKFGGVRRPSVSSEIPCLNVPWHLAVDGDGHVLVADSSNNRILLLKPGDESMECMSVFASGDADTEPCRLHLAGDRLYVASNRTSGRKFLSGHVSVFTYSPESSGNRLN